MTSSIINFIIDKYLANILEINPEKTQASLWSGTVELSNLKFKSSIFQTLNLPYLELVDGHIGLLRLTMSLPRFYLYPINVEVNDVFFYARQKSIDDLSKEQQIKDIETYKQSKLKNKEELLKQVNTLKDESPSILDQILKNINVTINNIVFRFEDTVSYVKHPFCFGAILESLTIKSLSTDEDSSFIKKKTLKLSNFSVFLDSFTSIEELSYHNKINREVESTVEPAMKTYLDKSLEFYLYCLSELQFYSKNYKDHMYLLYSLTFSIDLTMNDKSEVNHQPKMALLITFPHIEIHFDLLQIKTIMKEVNYIKLKTLYQKGLESEYYTKTLSEKEQKEYIEYYIEYYKTKHIQCYINKKENAEYLDKINKIESGLRYETIEKMRTIAGSQINFITSINGIDEEIKKIEGKWFCTDREAKLSKLKEQKEKVLKKQKEEYHTLFTDFMSTLSSANKIKLNKDEDYLQYDFNITLKHFQLNLKDKKRNELINVSLTSMITSCQISTFSQKVSLSVVSVDISQYIIDNKMYHDIIFTEEDSNKKILQVEYTHSPFLGKSDHKLEMKNEKEIIVVFNLYIIQRVAYQITGSLKSINFSNLGSIAKGEISNYIQAGYNNLFLQGDYTPFNIDVHCNMLSPKIIFPQDVVHPNNRSAILISLGVMKVESMLTERKNPNVDYSTVKDEKMLYDKYKFNVEGVTMEFIDTFEMTMIKEKRTKTKFIEDVGVSVVIDSINTTNNLSFANYVVSINVSDISVKMNDEEALFLIKVMENLQREQFLLEKAKEKNNKKMSHVKAVIEKGEKVLAKRDGESDYTTKQIEFIKKVKSKTISNIKTITEVKINFNLLNISLIHKEKQFVSVSLSQFLFGFTLNSRGDITLQTSFHQIKVIDDKSNQTKLSNEEKNILSVQLRIVPVQSLTDIEVSVGPMRCHFDFVFLADVYSYLNEKNDLLHKSSNKLKRELKLNNFMIDQMMDKEAKGADVKGILTKAKSKSAFMKMFSDVESNRTAIEEEDISKFCKEEITKNFHLMLSIEHIDLLISNDNDDKVRAGFSMKLNMNNNDAYIVTYGNKYRQNVKYYDYSKKDSQLIINVNDVTLCVGNEYLIKDISVDLSMESRLDLKTKYILSKTAITPKTTELDIKFNFGIIDMIISLYSSFNIGLYPLMTKPPTEEEIDQVSSKLALIKKKKTITKTPMNIDSFTSYTETSIEIPSIDFNLCDKYKESNVNFVTFSLSNASFFSSSNSDSSDGTNFANALIEMISGSRFPVDIYAKDSLYKYMLLKTSFRVDYHNLIIDERESLIEPIDVTISVVQVIKRMRQRIDITTNKMLDVNLSVNAMRMVNLVKEIYQRKKIKSKEINNDDDSVEIVIKNNTGNNVTFFFDANEKKKYDIAVDGEVNVTKKEIESLNKHSTMSFTFDDKEDLSVRYYYYNVDSIKHFNISNNGHVVIKSKQHDNLIRYITLSSPIKVINRTKFDNICLSVKNTSITFDKKKNIPLRWIINGNKINLKIDNNEEVLYEKIKDALNSKENSTKCITFSNGISICVDVHVLKLKFVENELYLYKIILLPPVIVNNMTPYQLTYNESNTIESLSKGGVYHTTSKDIKSFSTIVKDINVSIINGDKFTLSEHSKEDDTNLKFESNDKSVIEVNYKKEKDDFKFNDKFYDVKDTLTSSTKFDIMFAYLLTNNTNYTINIQPDDKSPLISIKPKSSLIASSISPKITLSANSSSYSSSFDISITQSSSFILKESSSNYLPLAITSKPSSLFASSTEIVIDHRFIVYNNMSYNIDIRQNKENSTIIPKKDTVISLQDDNVSKMKFSIGVDDKWSDEFTIDSLGHFDLKIEMKEQTETTFTYDDTIHYDLIRCIITSIDNKVYIIFTSPTFPLKEIHNESKYEMKLTSLDDDEVIVVKPNRVVPYVPHKRDKEVLMKCEIGQLTKKISFDKIEDVMFDINADDKYHLTTSPTNNNFSKTLKLSSFDDEQYKYYKNTFIRSLKEQSGMKVNVILYGVGISIIDEGPKELFYISLYKCDLSLNSLTKKNIIDGDEESYLKIILMVMNMQIDLCNENNANKIKSVLRPKIPLSPSNEKKVYEEVVPFVQLCVTKIQTKSYNDVNVEYPYIDFIIQEFNVFVDNEVINDIFSYIAHVSKTFVKEDAKKEIKNSNEDNNAKIIEQLIKTQTTSTNYMLIRYLSLSAMKIVLTLKIKFDELDISYIPFFITNVLSTVASSITSISNSHLSYTELLLNNVFSDPSTITSLLITHYKNQSLTQIYKIIGNLDLIGNPINLLNNVCTGCFELVNEPRKGFFKGGDIKHGIQKGVNSFVSNVVGGGLSSVSSITGSLLNATHRLQDNDTSRKEIDDATGVIDGAVKGLKGGFNDVKEGISGLFEKPYKGGVEGGVGGFFKGIGSGVVNAALCPVSAVLNIGHGVIKGAANMAKGKEEEKERFRKIRQFKEDEPIIPYSEKMTTNDKQIKHYVGNSVININIGNKGLMLDDSKNILFSAIYTVPYEKQGRKAVCVVTDMLVVCLYKAKNVIEKVYFDNVFRCNVQVYNDVASVVFILHNGDIRKIVMKESDIATKMSNVIKKMLKK